MNFKYPDPRSEVRPGRKYFELNVFSLEDGVVAECNSFLRSDKDVKIDTYVRIVDFLNVRPGKKFFELDNCVGTNCTAFLREDYEINVNKIVNSPRDSLIKIFNFI